ncbi:MAG: TGS domain-containing protein [Thermoproteus sp.]|nr:TGS domain-containing protein [Thermoproteus sp.]
MPANLPAEAKAKWLKVMEARTPEEKIRAMEEFLSAVPKHKGTEKLIKFVRRRLAELRREAEERRAKERSRGGGGGFYVKKDGDVQIAVVGPPSSGKTSLLKCLTSASLEPDEVPYSTVEPVPAMFVEDYVYIQLVKAPSLSLAEPSSDINSVTYALVRNADGVIIVLRSDQEPEKALPAVVKMFDEASVSLHRPRGIVKVERRGSGGVQILGRGRLVGASLNDVRALLNEYGIHHAGVYIEGEASLEDVEEALFSERLYKPGVVVISGKPSREFVDVAAKLDMPYVEADLLDCSIDRRKLLELLLEELGLIRVFTKQIHNDGFTPKPLVVKRDSTVGDVAKMIHSSLYENFKYAVVWRRELFPQRPKRVGLEYRLKDGDVVEIHA